MGSEAAGLQDNRWREAGPGLEEQTDQMDLERLGKIRVVQGLLEQSPPGELEYVSQGTLVPAVSAEGASLGSREQGFHLHRFFCSLEERSGKMREEEKGGF